MKKELKVNEVEIVNGTPVVRGQFGDTAFEAAPFRWGSKMLMKVEAPPKEDFTGKSVKELRQLCKDRGIKGHSRDGVTRADLVGLLGG